MKTATVRQIRHDFTSVLNLVQGGEDVTITLGNKPVARLGPPAAVPARRAKRIDGDQADGVLWSPPFPREEVWREAHSPGTGGVFRVPPGADAPVGQRHRRALCASVPVLAPQGQAHLHERSLDRGDRFRLYRSIHRKHHDKIQEALAKG